MKVCKVYDIDNFSEIKILFLLVSGRKKLYNIIIIIYNTIYYIIIIYNFVKKDLLSTKKKTFFLKIHICKINPLFKV